MTLDDVQQRAVDHAPKEGPVTIIGPAGSGKTAALVRRALRIATSGKSVVLTSPDASGLQRLRGLLARSPHGENLRCESLGDLAYDFLGARRLLPGGFGDVVAVDDARAVETFARIVARLFALDWAEFEGATLDPEVSGLRSPARFAAAAFRLIRKLRLNGIDAATFEREALRGATTFYGRLPNFASPQLTIATQPQHRDSLRASTGDLAHQHAREVDLAKILARLYREYCGDIVERGLLTPDDAVVEAAHAPPAPAGDVTPAILVDDAQDLSRSELEFVRTLGNGFETATFAGDPLQSTRAFEARTSNALRLAAPDATYHLLGNYRCPAVILDAARAIAAGAPVPANGPRPEDQALTTARFESARDEASAVARTIADLIARGLEPGRIALIARTLNCIDAYAEALLANDVPIDFGGEASLFELRPVQDALAPLWAIADPNRHDWLLRNLEAPWLAFSDATIATLCGSPADPQPLLFDLPEEPDDDDRRWDRQRDLRLARNVLRGDRDRDLPVEILARLTAFREARARWLADERVIELPVRVRLVCEETVLAVAADDARGRFARGLVARLAADVDRFARACPRATLLDYLRRLEAIATGGAETLRIETRDPDAVAVLDVEAAKGREFERVFIVDVRAGAFPRYYVPDAFVFSRGLGVISKDNVGDAARAQRTAKFSYAHHALDFRAKYNAQERRALACAMTRARTGLWVSASGRATQGKAAPELLEELRARSAR